MKGKFLPHLALLSVALIYGANYSIAKIVLSGGYIPPLAFIFFRVLCGVIVFQAVSRLFVREKIEAKDWMRLFICGMFGIAINQMFFFMGLERTSPIHASLIMLTIPFVVLIAGNFILKERITLRKLLGIIVGVTGAMLLILKNSSGVGQSSYLLGDFMVFINAASYGLYLVLVKPLVDKYHPITIVAWAFTFGAIAVLPIGSFYLGEIDWSSFLPSTWMSFAYVLLFTTVLAYFLNAFALQRVSPATSSIYIYLQPLIAGTISIFLGQDQLHLSLIAATLLIFTGVYLVSVTPNKTS